LRTHVIGSTWYDMTNTVTQDLLATLNERYKSLKDEMEEVKRLRAAIKTASNEQAPPSRKRSRKASDGPTFKDMIKAVLTEKGSGAEALEILDLIKAKFDKVIKRTSISPQLSRLKASGDLILDDKIWMLPQHFDSGIPSAPADDDALFVEIAAAAAAAAVHSNNLLPKRMPSGTPNTRVRDRQRSGSVPFEFDTTKHDTWQED